MTDNQPPAYSLDDDVLERAAEAIYRSHPLIAKSGADEWDNLADGNRDNWIGMVRAALPVLVPAIVTAAERSLLGQMIDEADYRGFDVYCETHIADSLADWLTDYLPAAEEREQDGAR